MKKAIILIALILIAALPLTAGAYYLDAPHNESNGFTCRTCHSDPAWWNHTPGDIDDTVRNFICLKCHDPASTTPLKGPGKGMHSDLAINGTQNWTTQCVDCHDPHYQDQLDWAATDAASLFLATATTTASSHDPAGGGYADGTTTITYVSPAAKAAWSDPSTWSAKTDAASATDNSRGLLLVPDTSNPNATYEVIAADNGTVTVKGKISTITVGQTFGLIYGQSIRSWLRDKNKKPTRPIKFFDSNGGFTDTSGNSNPDGICQVCHTSNKYWHNDGSLETHHPGEKCTNCHSHQNGFAHGGDEVSSICLGCHNSGQHTGHISKGIKCSSCHDLNNMFDANGNIVIDPLTDPKCDNCHKNPSFNSTYIFPDNTPQTPHTQASGGYDPVSKTHNPAADNSPLVTDYRQNWNTSGYTIGCDGCHPGRNGDGIEMDADGHTRLVSSEWIRHYPCWYCHYDTVDSSWNLKAAHADGQVEVKIDPQYNIAGNPLPSFDPGTSICDNVYCHSDGTTVNPAVRPYPWDGGHQVCNSCHGHDPTKTDCSQCHEPRSWAPEQEWLSAMPMYANEGAGMDRANSHMRHLFSGYACDECHADTVVGPCLDCHGSSIPTSGGMTEQAHINPVYHVNKQKTIKFKQGGTFYQVEPGTGRRKVCANTACHTGDTPPQWGGSVDKGVVCISCHKTNGPDVALNENSSDPRPRFNYTEWTTRGHGRPASAGSYPVSGNPPADFPGNGCWYCHDNKVLHKDPNNPYRLRQHQQYKKRFDKECVYCHMADDPANPGFPEESQCQGCHNSNFTLAPQLADITADSIVHPDYNNITRPDHSQAGFLDGSVSCSTANCHINDAHRHKTGLVDRNGNEYVWTQTDKDDVRNEYVMMGVCLKCHDDPSSGECTSCHTPPPDDPATPNIDESKKYRIGFNFAPSNPATFRTAAAARATSVHFGYKHFNDYKDLGVWKGGKFCWDCHDPHGDNNIFMIHDKVSTETDGTFGRPTARKTVSFTGNGKTSRDQLKGTDYARSSTPYNGICNVCHNNGAVQQKPQHYTSTSGDGHNSGRKCTNCHEHRFTDSHAADQACNTCHNAKPVPRHTGFSLPRDCTKCHDGTINNRMNIMRQFRSQSHHVQNDNGKVTGKQCYACHWEATSLGLINLDHHGGYNYKTHQTVSGDKVDLVIWGPGTRPDTYDPDGSITGEKTVTTFDATRLAAHAPTDTDWQTVGLPVERQEIENITPHCLGCHSDQNNDTMPFDDCKTPRQYAWDRSSIDSRYNAVDPQGNTTAPWGKYQSAPGAATKALTKAFSAHGHAVDNEGGFDPVTGINGAITNTRGGSHNVQCFDCHSSHGSRVSGTATSYASFTGKHEGGNFKETQAGKGGYQVTYMASANPDPGAVNYYNPGAGQCFDCHETATGGVSTPWGYNSQFGATKPIIGYKDNPHFKGSFPGKTEGGATNSNYPTESNVDLSYRSGHQTVGGHLHASSPLTNTPKEQINGLCTPCHDPHGVSRTLGDDMKYAVPMLKGTWLTSPYKEDHPPPMPYGPHSTATNWGHYVTSSHSANAPTSDSQPENSVNIDRVLFGDAGNTTRISETEQQFAGLCLRCHPKENLQNPDPGDKSFRSLGRIHSAVKGWGDNSEHSFPCAKCHQPHASGLPRLMRTNCLNFTHRGGVVSGGVPEKTNGESHGEHRSYPIASMFGASTPDNNYNLACHAKVDDTDKYPGATAWPGWNLWNNVTPW